jgi:2,3-dihydroxyphenylpropionate 1,2-dioxygenase
LRVPGETAMALTEAVRHADIDIDLSYHMRVDHGFTQLWEMALGRFDRFETVPIMINCAAPPRPQFRRVRLLGEAVGKFAAATGKRILFVGSGGLSHDPPIPNMTTANEMQRAFLLAGREPSQEMRQAREARVLAAAKASAANTSGHLRPDADWDGAFLKLLADGALAEVDSWSDQAITSVAGCGGHEVRTWIAAFAALDAAGGKYTFERMGYRIVPEWMTGMGVARGWSTLMSVG